MKEQIEQNSDNHDGSFLIYKGNKVNIFKNLLTNIDILGRKPKLLVGKYTRYKNATGGLLSICVIAIYIALFYVFAIDMIFKLHPIVTGSTEYDVEAKKITLTPDVFAFWIGLEDKNYDYFIDPTVYNIDIKWVSRSLNEKGVTTKVEKSLKSQPCNQINDMKTIFNGVFKTDDLKNLYCIDKSDTLYGKMNLTGSFENTNWEYFTVDFIECTNGTVPGVVCKNKETIDSILNEGYVAVNYIDNIFDTNNYTYPAIKIKKNLWTISSNSFYKEWTVFMKNVDVSTDDDFLFPDNKEKRKKETYLASDFDRELSYSTRKGERFVRIYFRLSSVRPVFLRTYKKIQNVVAEMSGFIYLVYYFFLYLIHYFDDVEMNKTLINYAMSFGLRPLEEVTKTGAALESELCYMNNPAQQYSERERDGIPTNISPSNDNVINSSGNNEDPNQKNIPRALSSIDVNQLHTSSLNITSYKSFDKKKISFNCREIISLAFCMKCNKKQDSVVYYKYGSKMVAQILDTRNILRKHVEHELLKRVLFNKHQFKIFDLAVESYTPSIDTVKLSMVEIFDQENKIRISNETVKSYHSVENSEDFISKSLKNLLDNKIKNALIASTNNK